MNTDDMSKQQLYDYVYSMMRPCYEKARQVNRNASYEVLKAYCREHKERHAAYRRDDQAWMREDLRARCSFEKDEPWLGEAKMAIYQNFRQAFLNHVSNSGCDREVFNELFEPYRSLWHNKYGEDFKGVITNKSFFFRFGE